MDPQWKDYDPFEDAREQKKQQQRTKRRRLRVRITRFAAVTLICAAILVGYLCLDVSKVRSVHVSGNRFFSTKDIIAMSGINEDSRYLLVFGAAVRMRLGANPLIETVTFEHRENHTIYIEVKETECIGYYWEDGKPMLLSKAGKSIPLKQEYYRCLSLLPLIGDSVDRELLLEAMQDVKQDVICQMSEIWPYISTYDDHMFRILMDDGNQVIGGADSIALINSYKGIMQSMKKNRVCLILDQKTETAYTKSCAEADQEEQTAKAAASQPIVNPDDQSSPKDEQ